MYHGSDAVKWHLEGGRGGKGGREGKREGNEGGRRERERGRMYKEEVVLL